MNNKYFNLVNYTILEEKLIEIVRPSLLLSFESLVARKIYLSLKIKNIYLSLIDKNLFDHIKAFDNKT